MSTSNLLKEHLKEVTAKLNNKITTKCRVEVCVGTRALGIMLHFCGVS